MASIQGVKDKIQGLIDTANATTGKADTDLTNAVGSLVFKSQQGVSQAINISYGDTAPNDTSKVWVKTSKPSKTLISSLYDYELGIGENLTLNEDYYKMSFSTFGGTAEFYDGKIYMFGGSSVSSITCFDTVNNTMSTLPIEFTRSYHSSVIDGDKVYLFGSASQTSILCYDITNQELREITTAVLPKATKCMGVAKVGNFVYLFGGIVGSSATNTIYRFNIADETIENLTETMGLKVPQSLGYIAVASMNGKIYLLGGGTSSSSGSSKNIYCLDTNGHKFTTLSAEFSNGFLSGSTATIGQYVYLINGRLGSNRTNFIYCFDMKAETLKTTSMITSAWLIDACSAVNNYSAYIISGNTNSGSRYNIMRLDSVGYVPTMNGVDEGEVLIVPKASNPEETTNNLTLLLHEDIEVCIGVDKVYKGTTDGVEQVEASVYKDGTWKLI